MYMSNEITKEKIDSLIKGWEAQIERRESLLMSNKLSEQSKKAYTAQICALRGCILDIETLILGKKKEIKK